MSPQRTDEAITARLDARLTAEAYATESQLTSAINTLPGTGLSLASGVLNIDDPFNSSGTFANLVAQGTTAADVGLGNVTNQSKADMFSNPTFTDTITIAGDNPKLTGLPLPIDSTDAANKSYVDALAQGIKSRTQANVLVDFNLDATYSSLRIYLVSNNGSNAYIINGDSNPTITLEKGRTYKFVVDAPGHPFNIQTVSGAYSSENVYLEGIQNAGAVSGTII
jgi:hypothetical protein